MTGHSTPVVIPRERGWSRGHLAERLRSAVGGPARLRVIVLLAGVLGLSAADAATVGAIAPELERSLRIGNTDIGLLVAASIGVGALATLPVGVWVDRINRTRLLWISVLLWSAAMIVSGAASSYPMLLITRLALGAVVATALPAVASLTGDLFPAAERGLIYGYILSGELIGAAFGFLVSGDVAAALSWRYSFWALAIPGFLLAFAIRTLLPEPARGGQRRLRPEAPQIRPTHQLAGHGDPAQADPEHSTAEQAGAVQQQITQDNIAPHPQRIIGDDPTNWPLPRAVGYVLSIPTNRLLIISSVLGYFFFSGLQTFAVIFMRGRFGLGQGVASTLLVVLGAGAILGVLVTGRIADRLIGRRYLSARPVVAGVAFLATAALLLPGLLTHSLVIAAGLFFLAAAALGGANPPLDAARLDLMHSRLWGRAESVRTALRSAFSAVAPLLFGYLSTRLGSHHSGFGQPIATANATAADATGLDHTFLIMLLPLTVAGLILLLIARRTYPRDVATAVASESEGQRQPEGRDLT
ncbi:MAG: MFS transporter [Actinomycetota bacterium]|nr:MFS transporter [Actinomycetota bacterium]